MISVYYFYPLTQSYSAEKTENLSVNIKLYTAEELPLERLTQVIRQLGNFIAVALARTKSQETGGNYCANYKEHPACAVGRWNFCKRQLTEKEMEECLRIEEQLDPISIQGIQYKTDGFKINRGDVDLMRRILTSVRNSLAG